MQVYIGYHLFSLLVIIHLVDVKKSQGVISSLKDFVYLDRFCFQSDTGTLEYTFKYPLFYPTQMLLLYYDTDDQWPKAYKQLSTCSQRVELLTNHSENNQIIKLNPYDTSQLGNGRCTTSEEWILCSGTRVFRSARSRWWFLALANCDPDDDDGKRFYNNETMGIYAEFSLQMTNGLPTEVMKYQFSIDEWLILPSDSIFLILQFIILIISYIIGMSLTSRRLYHNTYRMCSQSVITNTIGLVLLVTHYGAYAIDGVGVPVLKSIGQFVRAMADMLFIFMCLVLARGLNVTKMRLTMIDRLFLFFMIIFFIFSYLLMQIWEIKYFDPALVFSQSESLPGYLLALWRIIAWGFFLVSASYSRQSSPLKKSFFTYFIILMTPWFWASPVFVILANFTLNNWVRAEVVNIVENSVTLYGYIIFLWLARPTNGNTNFPFHIRTTQVDVDVGFDPNYAYAVQNENQSNEGLNGLPLELSATSLNNNNNINDNNRKHENDKGIPTRPQFSD